MSEINFHPDDKIMTSPEVIKKHGTAFLVFSIFNFMFFTNYFVEDGSTESMFMLVCCSLPLTLFSITILQQSTMHILGFGTMVTTMENEMVLRTSRSGLEKTSRFSFLNEIITYPMARSMIREGDKDGDGKLSYDEAIEIFFDNPSENEKPWEWDFKTAYDKISKKFNLPSDNSPISFDDFSVYTGSEDRTNFDEIDTDNDGFVTKEQFVEYFWEIDKSEFNEFRTHLDKCDVDGDGYLSVKELSKFMASRPDDNWAEEKTSDWWSNDDN